MVNYVKVYEAAGISPEKATAKLRRAADIAAKAMEQVRLAAEKCPDPPEQPEIPEPPTMRIEGEPSGACITLVDRQVGMVGRLFQGDVIGTNPWWFTKLAPIDLLSLTIETEAWANKVVAIANDYQSRCERITADLVADPALHALVDGVDDKTGG